MRATDIPAMDIPMYKLTSCLAALSAALFSLAACAGQGASPSGAPAASAPPAPAPDKAPPPAGGTAQLRDQMQKLRAMIVEEIGVPRADDIAQCATLPLGSRPCGGPQEYLPYSRQVAKERRLHMLAGEYSALERQFNEQRGLVGACVVAPVPKLTLDQGVCRTLPDGRGGGTPAVR